MIELATRYIIVKDDKVFSKDNEAVLFTSRKEALIVAAVLDEGYELIISPKIVCLCGSTRFKTAFEEATCIEGMKGNIVLSVVQFTHSDNINLDKETKAKLDELHLRKIDLCDEMFVLNVGGYIGESTRREIAYAESKAKDIRYLEQP